MLLTLSCSESLKASLYDYIGISVYFVYFIHINNNKFTYDKIKSAKFGFNILDMIYSSFIKIVYFLDKYRR